MILEWTLYLKEEALNEFEFVITSMKAQKIWFLSDMDVIKNSTSLRASSFRYKVHSRIIQNLLGKYYSHQLSRTRQDKEHLVDTNNQHQITRWAQKELGLNQRNQKYTEWELSTACKHRVLTNTSYAHLTSEYGIPHSTLKMYLTKICEPLKCRDAQHVHESWRREKCWDPQC